LGCSPLKKRNSVVFEHRKGAVIREKGAEKEGVRELLEKEASLAE